jgi:hypothetical protein
VMPEAGWIYVLKDPRTKEIRYVGKTVQRLSDRLRGHLRVTADHRGAWVGSLLRIGTRPIIEAVDEVPVDQLGTAERTWIATLREAGVRLTNVGDGGEGSFGWRLGKPKQIRSETRLKWSEAQKRRHASMSEGDREAFRQQRAWSEERRLAASAAMMGNTRLAGFAEQPKTEEHRSKISVSMKRSWSQVSEAEKARRIAKMQEGKARRG